MIDFEDNLISIQDDLECLTKNLKESAKKLEFMSLQLSTLVDGFYEVKMAVDLVNDMDYCAQKNNED